MFDEEFFLLWLGFGFVVDNLIDGLIGVLSLYDLLLECLFLLVELWFLLCGGDFFLILLFGYWFFVKFFLLILWFGLDFFDRLKRVGYRLLRFFVFFF